MKILCLHGFRHNSKLLKKSMESSIKKLSRLNISFIFYDSPFKFNSDASESNDFRQWWSATREDVLTQEKYDTVEQSITNLKQKWESDKYDGLLGFSQGSVLAQIFAYEIQNKIISTYEPLFIILASTSPISDSIYKKYYEKPLLYKTLLIAGSKDIFVDINTTLILKKYFINSQTIIHKGGHYFSTSSETHYLLKEFLQGFMK